MTSSAGHRNGVAGLVIAALAVACPLSAPEAQMAAGASNSDTRGRVASDVQSGQSQASQSQASQSNVAASGSRLSTSHNSGRSATTNPTQDNLFSGSSRPNLRSGGAIQSGSPAQKATRAPVARLRRAPVQREVIVPVAIMPAPTQERLPLRRRRAEEDPYAPLGLRHEGLTLLPALEQSVGYDSNPNRARGGAAKGSMLLRTDVETRLQSDWRTHALTGLLRGSYLWYPGIDGANRPELTGQLTYRHDFSRDTQGELELRGRLDTQRPGSPDLTAAVKDRPATFAVGTTAGLTQRFNRLSFTLRGTIDRTSYQDATLTNGTVLSQSDRDLTQFGSSLRGSYDISPGLTPFVEALIDTRRYDDKTDRFGFQRDSLGTGARAGIAFQLSQKLTGEAAVGYRTRHYEDNRLSDLRGAIADAALIWSISPITSARVNLSTTLDETTIVGSSGAITQRIGSELTHDFQRNLALTVGGSAQRSDYRGVRLTEDTYTGSIKLDYKLSRSVVVRASYAHERLLSSTPGGDFTANIYLLGLKLQR